MYVRSHTEMRILLEVGEDPVRFETIPRNGNQHIHEFILSLSLVQCSEDHCVYKTVVDSHVVVLAMFVC